MVMNGQDTRPDEVKSERRRIKKHRSEGMKRFVRMTRDKQKIFTALFYLFLCAMFVLAGYTFLFTPGSFSGD